MLKSKRVAAPLKGKPSNQRPNQPQAKRNVSLREQVQRKVLHSIITGDLKPGTKIVESTLSRELHVSRTPLREALLGLEKEGLVISDGGRGYAVAPLTAREVREIYPMIMALEGLALQTAWSSGAVIDTAELKKINGELARTKNQPSKAAQLDVQWHNALLRHCPNRRLIAMLAGLKQQIERYERKYMSDPSLIPVSVATHEEIIKAIEKRDLSRVKELLEENFRFGMETLLRQLDWL